MPHTSKFKKTIKSILFIAIAGAPMVLANVPRSNDIANDTAIYQNLHEINVQKVKNINFDSDISRLSAQEKAHHESLPLSLSGPMERSSKSVYQYSGKRRRSNAH